MCWGIYMAKQRKTERVTEREEIEQLWAFYRQLDERVAAIEDVMGDEAEYSLTDAGLDKLVAEAMAARPWYAKVGSWLKRGENLTSAALFGVSLAFIALVIALIAR